MFDVVWNKVDQPAVIAAYLFNRILLGANLAEKAGYQQNSKYGPSLLESFRWMHSSTANKNIPAGKCFSKSGTNISKSPARILLRSIPAILITALKAKKLVHLDPWTVPSADGQLLPDPQGHYPIADATHSGTFQHFLQQECCSISGYL